MADLDLNINVLTEGLEKFSQALKTSMDAQIKNTERRWIQAVDKIVKDTRKVHDLAYLDHKSPGNLRKLIGEYNSFASAQSALFKRLAAERMKLDNAVAANQSSLVTRQREEIRRLALEQHRNASSYQRSLARIKASADLVLNPNKRYRGRPTKADQAVSEVPEPLKKVLGGVQFVGGMKIGNLTSQVNTLSRTFAKMGGSMAVVGKALGALGGTMAIFGAIYSIVTAIDGKYKEQNRSLLNQKASVGDIGKNFSELEDTFSNMREAASFSFLTKWGITTKDLGEVLSTFNETGFTIGRITKELANGTDQAKAFQEAVGAALHFSTLLGTSQTDMATQMGGYMEHLGYSLSAVKDEFAGIYEVARSSGFATGKFFTMVLQASTGQTMFNLRLAETAALLKNLASSIGLENAAKFGEGLKGTVVGTTPTEILQNMIISGAGGADITQLFKDMGKRNIRNYLETNITDSRHLQSLENAMAQSNILNKRGGAEGISEAIMSATSDQLNKLLGKLSHTDVPRPAIQKLNELISGAVFKAAQGNVDPSTLALASEGLSIVDMIRLAQGRAKTFGVSDITNLKGTQSIQMERAGFNLDMQRQMSAVLRAANAKWAELQDFAKSTTGPLSDEVQKDLIRRSGVALRDGKFYEASLGGVSGEKMIVSDKEVSKDSLDFLTMHSQVDPEDLLSEQEKTARAHLQATEDITKHLTRFTDVILNRIFGGVGKIFNWLYKDDSNAEALKALEKGEGIFHEKRGELQQDITNVEKLLAETEGYLGQKNISEYERTALEDVKKTAEEAIAKYTENLEQFDNRLSELQELQGDPKKAKSFKKKALASWNADPENQVLIKDLMGNPTMGTKAASAQEKMEWYLKKHTLSGDESFKNRPFFDYPGYKQTIQFHKDQMAAAKKQVDELKGLPSHIGKAVADEMRKSEDSRAVLDALGKIGGDLTPMEMQKIANTIAGGEGLISGPIAEKLLGSGASFSPEVRMRLLGSKHAGNIPGLENPSANDFLLQMGSNGQIKLAQRIDANDTALFAKPGGAVHKAGRSLGSNSASGGGGRIIHNHFYNDGQSIWTSLERYWKAMGEN